MATFDVTYRSMNQHAKVDIRHSTCPHDCPSACALDIEVIGGQSIGRVRGSKLQSYTRGVVCAKVARYAERIHHPDRLLQPMRRTGPKGSGAYVAMERVTGKLGGRSGSFMLQHSSSMNRGVLKQNITVVPESGTGELAGLEGKMTIR